MEETLKLWFGDTASESLTLKIVGKDKGEIESSVLLMVYTLSKSLKYG